MTSESCGGHACRRTRKVAVAVFVGSTASAARWIINLDELVLETTRSLKKAGL